MGTQSTEFTGAGNYTFNVPSGVSIVWVTMCGGGSGGAHTSGSAAAGGGGSGEIVIARPLAVTPGGTVTGSIGAGGAGATSGGTVGSAGGDTTCGPFTAKGSPAMPVPGNGSAGGGMNAPAANTVGDTSGTLPVQNGSHRVNGGEPKRSRRRVDDFRPRRPRRRQRRNRWRCGDERVGRGRRRQRPKCVLARR